MPLKSHKRMVEELDKLATRYANKIADEAWKVLVCHPELGSFLDSMGVTCFYNKQGNPCYFNQPSNEKDIQAVFDFCNEYLGVFGSSGVSLDKNKS